MRMLKALDSEIKALYRLVSRGLVAVLALREGNCGSLRDLTTSLLSISTGFAVDEGLIVSSFHSISGASRVCVIDSEEESVLEARVEGYDERWDVALLAVEGLSKSPLALSRKVPEIGSIVIALGSAYGYGLPALVIGVVSSLGRRVIVGGKVIEGLMMVEAHSYGGMSGAPLVDVEGVVVGMVIAQEARLGTMFAVPAKWISYDIDMLKRRGFVASPRLGISMALAKVGTHHFRPVITRIEPDSEAERCGLLPGDVIIEIGEREVFTIEDVWEEIYRAAVIGMDIKIAVLRGSRKVERCCRLATLSP